jgi:MFS family permease
VCPQHGSSRLEALGVRTARLSRVRRLLTLVCATMFVDTALFGAIVPLVPELTSGYALSKAEAGLLVAGYGAGAMVAGIPGGMVSARVGPKKAVVVGLLLLAGSSVAFAFAGSPLTLGLARFAQGLSSALTWAGALAWLVARVSRERRGAVLGTAFSFAVVGFVCGPFVGGIAAVVSIRWTFVGCSIAVAALALTASRQPSAGVEALDLPAVRRALADRAFVAALWLSLLPAFAFGMFDVLVPLALDDAGYGAAMITIVFVVAGLTEAAVSPIAGHVSDRRGRLGPIRFGLAASTVVATLLAVATAPWALILLLVAAAITFGSFYAPGISLVSIRAERAALSQSLGFGVMNTAWALGALLGPLLGGSLAHGVGDGGAYLLTAAVCAATFLALTLAAPGRMQTA